jgi:membrane protein YqaA with SNARE-associated domain
MLSLWLLTSPVLHFARRFGPLAFFGLGLADNSVIPLPGSMDALAIFFAASKPEWWWYYALMATAGSLFGAYVDYGVAQKGGHATLDKRLGRKRAERARAYFDRMGFWSIFIGALAPPPTPTGAIILVAGALEYPMGNFIAAIMSARLIRYFVVTWIASHYGRAIFQFFSRYYKLALYSLVGLAVVGGVVGLVYYLRQRRKGKIVLDAGTSDQKAA